MILSGDIAFSSCFLTLGAQARLRLWTRRPSRSDAKGLPYQAQQTRYVWRFFICVVAEAAAFNSFVGSNTEEIELINESWVSTMI
jgi:hypothetical protein